MQERQDYQVLRAWGIKWRACGKHLVTKQLGNQKKTTADRELQ